MVNKSEVIHLIVIEINELENQLMTVMERLGPNNLMRVQVKDANKKSSNKVGNKSLIKSFLAIKSRSQ